MPITQMKLLFSLKHINHSIYLDNLLPLSALKVKRDLHIYQKSSPSGLNPRIRDVCSPKLVFCRKTDRHSLRRKPHRHPNSDSSLDVPRTQDSRINNTIDSEIICCSLEM